MRAHCVPPRWSLATGTGIAAGVAGATAFSLPAWAGLALAFAADCAVVAVADRCGGRWRVALMLAANRVSFAAMFVLPIAVTGEEILIAKLAGLGKFALSAAAPAALLLCIRRISKSQAAVLSMCASTIALSHIFAPMAPSMLLADALPSTVRFGWEAHTLAWWCAVFGATRSFGAPAQLMSAAPLLALLALQPLLPASAGEEPLTLAVLQTRTNTTDDGTLPARAELLRQPSAQLVLTPENYLPYATVREWNFDGDGVVGSRIEMPHGHYPASYHVSGNRVLSVRRKNHLFTGENLLGAIASPDDRTDFELNGKTARALLCADLPNRLSVLADAERLPDIWLVQANMELFPGRAARMMLIWARSLAVMSGRPVALSSNHGESAVIGARGETIAGGGVGQGSVIIATVLI